GADSPWRTSSTVVAPGGAVKRCWRKPSGGVVLTTRDYFAGMIDDEFIPMPGEGRVVTMTRTVGLGDVRPDARVRLDALARFVQDVADTDASTAPMHDKGVWVMRRLALRIDRTPRLRADVTLRTWCSGVGARWAERSTDLAVGSTPAAQAV